jgi:G:T-mismatch repair DNA endonuclease (very short patch repair protein)
MTLREQVATKSDIRLLQWQIGIVWRCNWCPMTKPDLKQALDRVERNVTIQVASTIPCPGND